MNNDRIFVAFFVCKREGDILLSTVYYFLYTIVLK